MEGAGRDLPDPDVGAHRRGHGKTSVNRMAQVAERAEVAQRLAGGEVPEDRVLRAGDEPHAVGREGHAEQTAPQAQRPGDAPLRHRIDVHQDPDGDRELGAIAREGERIGAILALGLECREPFASVEPPEVDTRDLLGFRLRIPAGGGGAIRPAVSDTAMADPPI